MSLSKTVSQTIYEKTDSNRSLHLWTQHAGSARRGPSHRFWRRWDVHCLGRRYEVDSFFLVGKRDGYHAKAFIADLAERGAERRQLSSDSLAAYGDVVERGFGADADSGQISKTDSLTNLMHSKHPGLCVAGDVGSVAREWKQFCQRRNQSHQPPRHVADEILSAVQTVRGRRTGLPMRREARARPRLACGVGFHQADELLQIMKKYVSGAKPLAHSVANRVMRFFSMARTAVLPAERTRLIRPANRASWVSPCW